MTEEIENVLKNLPEESGVYLYRDANGAVIYVGKAKVLKNRVRSYFHSSGLNAKTRMLVSRIANISYIVTANEAEALLLENNLIKKYKPKYNILLKDDKGYPYLRLDTREPFPQLTLARRLVYDGADYFGPYHGASGARALADIATELYPLRTCRYTPGMRPCIKSQIGRCPAPCINNDRELYRKNVEGVISFLRGDQSEALEGLKKKMLEASAQQDYERAAQLRDRLQQAGMVLSKQKVVLPANESLDVAAVLLKNAYAVACTLHVRSGRLIGVHISEWSEVNYESEEELLEKFLIQQYARPTMVPGEIICGKLPESAPVIESMIRQENHRAVHLAAPSRGKKHELYQMALRNARERMEKSLLHTRHVEERAEQGLDTLRELLQLPDRPHRMECFDISHIQGTDTVASMVVFTDGLPDKKEYRRFKIKTVEGNNDFASMHEVTSRRYKSGLNGEKGFASMPDLIIIDGGKGQLSNAQASIRELGLQTPMIGLAKRLEEIYLPGRSMPYLLPYSSPALQILQSIRDEAHRFAITFHRSLRGKRSLLSVLDEIPGIGKTRKKALYTAFSTVAAIREAELAALEAVPSMNRKSAEAVYAFFHKDA